MKNLGKDVLQISLLEHPSISEYWEVSGVPVLPKNVVFMFIRRCWCYADGHRLECRKWSGPHFNELKVKKFRNFEL